jgi:hypothetical protein
VRPKPPNDRSTAPAAATSYRGSNDRSEAVSSVSSRSPGLRSVPLGAQHRGVGLEHVVDHHLEAERPGRGAAAAEGRVEELALDEPVGGVGALDPHHPPPPPSLPSREHRGPLAAERAEHAALEVREVQRAEHEVHLVEAVLGGDGRSPSMATASATTPAVVRVRRALLGLRPVERLGDHERGPLVGEQQIPPAAPRRPRPAAGRRRRSPGPAPPRAGGHPSVNGPSPGVGWDAVARGAPRGRRRRRARPTWCQGSRASVRSAAAAMVWRCCLLRCPSHTSHPTPPASSAPPEHRHPAVQPLRVVGVGRGRQRGHGRGHRGAGQEGVPGADVGEGDDGAPAHRVRPPPGPAARAPGTWP